VTHDFDKRPNVKKTQNPRTQAPSERERQQARAVQQERDAEKARKERERLQQWEARSADPEVQTQLEAARSAGVEPNLRQIYGMAQPPIVEFRNRILQARGQQVAQAAPMGPPVGPMRFPLPFPVPWKPPQRLNPLNRQPTQSDEERRALQNLTPAQLNGLQNSSLKDNIPYAATSFKQNQCTFIDVAVGNGGPVHSMMTEALTGALNPTMVVTPGGSAALFDGQYRADLARLKQRKGQLFEVESIVPPTNAAQMKAAQAFVLGKLSEWKQQAAIAHSCGTSLRVALPDQELAAWANQQLKVKVPGLAITEGKWGGTYGQVRADTVGGQVHHAPSNDVTKETTDLGSAVWMTVADHKKTASNGSSDAARIYRLRQQRLINSGHYDQAQQEDVRDIRRVGQGLYDIPVLQMLKTRKRNLLNGTHKR
jgi:hypothetical protein